MIAHFLQDEHVHTCGSWREGSTRLSMASTKQVVFPLPLCAYRQPPGSVQVTATTRGLVTASDMCSCLHHERGPLCP